MKVLFIHNSIPEYRVPFMRELTMLCDVEYLITEPNLAAKIYDVHERFDISGLSISYLRGKWQLLNIRKKITTGKYNIVVLPPADNLFQFLCGYVAMKTAKSKKKKIVYWTEKWEKTNAKIPVIKQIKNKIQGCFIGWLARKVDMCIAAGSCSKKYLHSLGIEDKKIRIAFDSSTSPMGQYDNIRTRYGLKLDSKLILFMGRLIARKGADLLIQAFADIVRRDDNTFLMIGGDGPALEQCLLLVESFQISKRVFFLGQVSPKERGSLYKQMDVFVLPSYMKDGTLEAWGLTVNEALEQGTPVVSTDAVGAAYDLLDGECGVMVENGNIKCLTDGLIRFVTKRKNKCLEQICKERYSSYSVVNMANQFYETFKICVF